VSHPSIQPKEAADSDKDGPPGSIWPTWKYTTYLDHEKSGKLLYRMPFDPLFWRAATRSDVVNSWNVSKDATVQQLAPMTSPGEVQGFIVALPTRWTRRENNLSIRTHIRALAGLEGMPRSGGEVIQQAATRTGSGQEPA
jgi:phospholipase D1/2